VKTAGNMSDKKDHCQMRSGPKYVRVYVSAVDTGDAVDPGAALKCGSTITLHAVIIVLHAGIAILLKEVYEIVTVGTLISNSPTLIISCDL
jgi:hypothetical protein